MSKFLRTDTKLPPEQLAIRAKCFHPSGRFEEFTKKEVEQSIPERFEKIVKRYPDPIAIEGRWTGCYLRGTKSTGKSPQLTWILDRCGERKPSGRDSDWNMAPLSWSLLSPHSRQARSTSRRNLLSCGKTSYMSSTPEAELFVAHREIFPWLVK